MQIKFCPIASGSSGNSIYVGTEKTHVLIDAGLSGITVQNGLAALNVSGNSLDAIFITHEHSDHIKGVGILSRRFDVPVYATPKTWDVMEKFNHLGKIERKNKKVIHADEPLIINDMCVKAFAIPHDAAEPVGYTIKANDIKIAVATDIGHVTDIIRESIFDCDAMLLESNHDIEMLENGRYPKALKDRILGKRGHLSNVSAGRLLTEIMNSRLKHVFLGHLSEENNRPLIALDTVSTILNAEGIFESESFKLSLAERYTVSEAFVV